jgi:transcriptional regulator with XRE-family HTH domain
MKLLRENIRKIRELRNYTQEYMADQLGLSVSGYGKIERSDSDINLSRITQIAEVLNVSRTSLLEFNSDDMLKSLDEDNSGKSNNPAPTKSSIQASSLSHDDFSTLLDIIRSLREENAKLKAELEKLKG